jgi:hypothetical protein
MVKRNALARRPVDQVVTTRHRLLTAAWTADVDALERAVERFTLDRVLSNRCDVAFFEVAGDRELHVNITHRHQTREVPGWAGPASMPEGFVHNRRFSDAKPATMIRQIRDMVFAERS